jgi:hypothetical protein
LYGPFDWAADTFGLSGIFRTAVSLQFVGDPFDGVAPTDDRCRQRFETRHGDVLARYRSSAELAFRLYCIHQ